MRKAGDQTNYCLQEGRHPFIVCIEKGDQIILRLCDPTIASGGHTLILLANNPNALIDDPRGPLRAVIRGAIIHDNNFKVLYRLT
ncbi:MAG TPA: hypothetical protein VLI39_10985 [Sedimentisphaerales bacterium]|nr:hypothetical protein [Sedimentisphaerales bacterium]